MRHFGYISLKDVVPYLVKRSENLEYHEYDFAGMAVIKWETRDKERGYKVVRYDDFCVFKKVADNHKATKA